MTQQDHPDGGAVLTHRQAYEERVGPIPAGLNVLHQCDNPPCMEPSHLFTGTQQDNVDDCAKKDRRRQVRPASRKLTSAEVDEIRRRALPNKVGRLSNTELAAGFEPQSALAARFGVSQAVVSMIVRGQTYREEPCDH